MPIAIDDTSRRLQALCTKEQWRLLEKFIALLRAYNTKVNLMSRKDTHAIIDHHLAPSFLFTMLHRMKNGETVLDIGSGNGFPGIVAAILLPRSEFVLVEATRKKAVFLETMVREVRLANAQVICTRVEDLAAEKRWLHYFDHTICRAVAPLAKLIQWSRPLLREDGMVEALKAKDDAQRELKSISLPASVFESPADWQWHEYVRRSCIVSVRIS